MLVGGEDDWNCLIYESHLLFQVGIKRTTRGVGN